MPIAATDNPPSTDSPLREPMVRRVARFGSPVTLFLALVLFALPFLSVSCDAPGGYGKMSAGGTTTYTGLDLATGAAPSVDEDHLRPPAEQQSDDLGVQPLIALAALAVLGAIVVPFMAARHGRLSALLAVLGLVLLAIGTLLARATLVDRVAEQATAPFASGKSAGDYVKLGIGFWIVSGFIFLGAVFGELGRRRPD
jgi:hypothetical protein